MGHVVLAVWSRYTVYPLAIRGYNPKYGIKWQRQIDIINEDIYAIEYGGWIISLLLCWNLVQMTLKNHAYRVHIKQCAYKPWLGRYGKTVKTINSALHYNKNRIYQYVTALVTTNKLLITIPGERVTLLEWQITIFHGYVFIIEL